MPVSAASPGVLRHLPNLLTAGRLVLAPFVVYCIWSRQHMMAAVLFAVAAATDGIDGFLARRLHAASRAGAYLDPIADKLLLGGVYLALASIRSVPWWLVALIFGRDLLILAAAITALLFTRVRAFPPSVWGKISTFFQIMTAVSFLARNALGTAMLSALCEGLIWPTAAMTIWSGLDYGRRGSTMLRTH